MFDTNGDIRNVIEWEKAEREIRTNKKKKEIKSHMRPFSFYDVDFKSFYERKNKECLPPKFLPFKANPIHYKSQVNNIYEGNTDWAKNKRRKDALKSFKYFQWGLFTSKNGNAWETEKITRRRKKDDRKKKARGRKK